MSVSHQPGHTARVRVLRDAGETVDYYSNRAFNKPQYIWGRVSAWEPIRRELSDEQGSYSTATTTLTLNDDDENSHLRAAVSEDPTRYQKETEVKIGVLSHEGRGAGIADRTIFRAKLDGPPAFPVDKVALHHRRRRLQLKLADALKPYLDSQINKALFTRAAFPQIDRALENTPIPLIGGEHSDAGAVSITGGNGEQGMVPLIYVGTYTTVNDDPLGAVSTFLALPSGLIATADGTPGTRTVYYGVSFFSASGETTQTIVQLTTSATVINTTDSNTITWDAPPAGTTAVAVYRSDYPTPNRRLALLGSTTTSYTDDGTSSPLSISPPIVNQAKIPDVNGGFPWDLWVVGLGVVPITGLFGSDDAKGKAPSRINLLDTAGRDFLIPGYSGWIGPTLYLEIGGMWLTCILGRGPRSQQAKDGIVTLTVSTCGLTDVSDGTGQPIQEYFLLMQHFLNQFGLLNNGAGWTSGDWGALEKFSDGVEIINSESTFAMQALTKLFLDDDFGYQGHIYLRDPTTVREFLQLAFQTADAFGGTNHHGQFQWFLYNPLVDVTMCRTFRQYVEIMELESPEFDDGNLEPKILFQYDYNPDTQKYRSEVEQATDEASSLVALSLVNDARGIKLLRFTRDQRTARDAMNRRKARLRAVRYAQSFVCKYRPGLEVELGDTILITHQDGPIPRWVTRPFFVRAHEANPQAGTVTISGVDVQALLDSVAEWAPDSVPTMAADGTAEEQATYWIWTDEDGSIPGGGNGSEWL